MPPLHYGREMLALLGRIVEQSLLVSLLLLILSLVLLLPLACGVLIAVPTSVCERLLIEALAGLIVLVGACLLLFPFWFLLSVRQEPEDAGDNHTWRTIVAGFISIGALILLFHLWPASSTISTASGSRVVPLVWMGAVDLLLLTGTAVGKVLCYVTYTKLSLDEQAEGEQEPVARRTSALALSSSHPISK